MLITELLIDLNLEANRDHAQIIHSMWFEIDRMLAKHSSWSYYKGVVRMIWYGYILDNH